MQFIDNAPLYRIIRITGPQHNLLGLELTEGDQVIDPVIEMLDASKNAKPRLQSDEVAAQVVKGIANMTAQIGKRYQIKRIQFLASDSPPAEIYAFLAQEIIRRIAS